MEQWSSEPDTVAEAPRVAAPRRRRHRSAAPVFVDTSGRRQRRIRHLGRLLAIPAAGYVVLLLSSVLGGPRVSAPFLPLPPPPPSALTSAPDSTHTTTAVPLPRTASHSAGSAARSSANGSAPTVRTTAAPTLPTAGTTPVPTPTASVKHVPGGGHRPSKSP